MEREYSDAIVRSLIEMARVRRGSDAETLISDLLLEEFAIDQRSDSRRNGDPSLTRLTSMVSVLSRFALAETERDLDKSLSILSSVAGVRIEDVSFENADGDKVGLRQMIEATSPEDEELRAFVERVVGSSPSEFDDPVEG